MSHNLILIRVQSVILMLAKAIDSQIVTKEINSSSFFSSYFCYVCLVVKKTYLTIN